MPTLQTATFKIDIKPAKTHGLADLGVPLADSTEVKKGKLTEAMQMLDGGKIGRRFQNVRATLLKADEGGQAGVKLVLAFEVFGDDNAPLREPAVVSAIVHAGDKVLAEQTLGGLFLPYGSFWYENRFSIGLPLDAFAAADAVSLVAAADEVRLIA